MNCRHQYGGGWSPRGFLVLLGGILLTQTITLRTTSAQDFDRYRPNPPAPKSQIPELPEPPDEPVEGSTDELVSALKGIMIIDHESRVQDPIKPFEGVRIDPAADLTVAREKAFKDILQPYLGQPITIRALNEMARNIVLLYRDYKQPVVDVSMPPGQDITDGVVQVVITESRIGDIEFRGNCWFSDCILQKQGWLRPGQRIYEPCLQNELIWYNRNPFREVSVDLEPGDAAGTTDIIYKVQDQRPVRFYAGYNDTGTQLTGLERLFYGFNWGNVGGKDHQMSYQFQHDARMAGIVGVHSFTYEIPIFENRDTFMLFGSYANFSIPTPVGGGGAGGTVDGTSWQLSGRYRHTLCRTKCQQDTFQFGIDTKGTDNTFDFTQNGVPANIAGDQAHIVQFMAGLTSAQQYSDGQTLYGVDFFVSPSNLLPENRTGSFKTLRADAHAIYSYLRAYLERSYEVDCRSDLVLRMTGQVSTSKLLPTEQLTFGGFNSIRGYNMSTINGDNGYIANLEYRSKPLYGCFNGHETNFTMLAFGDLGQSYNWGNDPNLVDDQFLASAGFGFRYLLNPHFTMRFDYGVPLVRPDNGAPFHQSGRVHIGIVGSY